MPKLNCGGIGLNYLEQGMGPDVVPAFHGNLGCVHWLAPVYLHYLPACVLLHLTGEAAVPQTSLRWQKVLPTIVWKSMRGTI